MAAFQSLRPVPPWRLEWSVRLLERILYPTIIDLLTLIPARYKLAIILSYYT